MKKTILAIFAHPDDEAFGTGGTLALYASQGYRVVLVCTTSGESGVNRLDENDTAQLGKIRREELRAACRQLNIEPPVFLDNRDSGMVDTPENDHPDSLHQADLDEVARELVGTIRREDPGIVITFEQDGWYGHPDHVKTYQAVRRAFELLGDDERPELYMAVFAAEAAIYSAWVMQQNGEEIPQRFRNPQLRRYPLDAIPIVVDTSPLREVKIRALNEHRTQMGADGIENRWDKELLRVRTDREYFLPAANHDALPEILPFTRSGGLFGEPAPDPLVSFPIVAESELNL